MYYRRMRVKNVLALVVAAMIVTACTIPIPAQTALPSAVVLIVTSPPTVDVTPTPEPTPTATAWPYPWTDENAVMSGICFESAYDAAGRTFVLRNPEALIHFYDLADHSELCRHPVQRNSFSFDGGRVLAGLWSRGRGCTARHEIEDVHRDDTARTLFIFLRLVTEGDCNYELVRPFWIGIDGLSDYEIQFVVE